MEKCKKDCGVFKATNCNNETFDDILQFKGEAIEINNKTVKHHL